MRDFSVVITTINSQTLGIKKILENSKKLGFEVFIIADKKTPKYPDYTQCFVSISDQQKLDFEISKKLPFNSYSRKMLGYLLAAQTGKNYIKETDDDNIPYKSFFDNPEKSIRVRNLNTRNKFINPLSSFTKKRIWPRGFPLDEILENKGLKENKSSKFYGEYIEQCLAELDPDVDAIYRLTNPQTANKIFLDKPALVIPKNAYAPFNSQCTTWPRSVLPLMYLPVTCSFRMTDIWRSYIAQRILRNLNVRLVYTKAKVKQVRNDHNLMGDFIQEMDGYLRIKEFVEIIEKFKPKKGLKNVSTNLALIYSILIENNFFHANEMNFLNAWIKDVNRAMD